MKKFLGKIFTGLNKAFYWLLGALVHSFLLLFLFVMFLGVTSWFFNLLGYGKEIDLFWNHQSYLLIGGLIFAGLYHQISEPMKIEQNWSYFSY